MGEGEAVADASTSHPIRDYRVCPLRKLARGLGDCFAQCGLLERLVGSVEPSLARVSDANCQDCSKYPVPSMVRLNPLVASLLYDAASTAISEEGVAGCSVDSARSLQHWAMQHLRAHDLPSPLSECGEEFRGRSCDHLGAVLSSTDEETSYRCLHENHPTTSEDQCQLCSDWSSERLGRADRLENLLPPPRGQVGPAIRAWAVGVTTSFRQVPTLDACLDSVIRAGWRYPRVFMDGEVPLAKRHQYLPVTLREPKIRAWGSYYLALNELLMREPHADAFLLIQDDALFFDQENLPAFLERSFWPSGPMGAISLYCSSVETQSSPGWYTFQGMWQWGAMAFVFSRESAMAFVTDPHVLAHRWCRLNDGCANIDTEIGLWAHRTGRKVYFPTPSLVQHIGDVSTLWPGARASGARRADQFVGELRRR